MYCLPILKWQTLFAELVHVWVVTDNIETLRRTADIICHTLEMWRFDKLQKLLNHNQQYCKVKWQMLMVVLHRALKSFTTEHNIIMMHIKHNHDYIVTFNTFDISVSIFLYRSRVFHNCCKHVYNTIWNTQQLVHISSTAVKTCDYHPHTCNTWQNLNWSTLCSAKVIIVPRQIIWSWYTGCWWVGCHIWYSEEETGRGHSPPRPILAVPNVTTHPSAASAPITILRYSGPSLCGFNVLIKGLTAVTRAVPSKPSW